jgi:hypothetical protein
MLWHYYKQMNSEHSIFKKLCLGIASYHPRLKLQQMKQIFVGSSLTEKFYHLLSYTDFPKLRCSIQLHARLCSTYI